MGIERVEKPIEVYEYEGPKGRNIAKYVAGLIVAVVIILALLYLFI